MKNIHISFCLFIWIAFSCSKEEVSKTTIYNQKANDLIFQTLKENNCKCILEIPEESLVDINNSENPGYDIKSKLKMQLNLKTDANLDSLLSVSKNFKLDSEKIKVNKIKIVSSKDIWNIKKGEDSHTLELCKTGIFYIVKPIFNENYTKAAFDYGLAFSCVKLLPTPIYEFKKDKWIVSKN
ncbi:hypothetical protein WFZ85_12920 [Flavobacterium sp. j3]|uniref:Lipoprotein n=1 Tax=Flavobacterium aureirubrum TaxID=3133147 RepID=A0ABU9N750_9FLAO